MLIDNNESQKVDYLFKGYCFGKMTSAKDSLSRGRVEGSGSHFKLLFPNNCISHICVC